MHEFVEAHRLMGSGIGWIDAHLLASAVLARTPLWSMDAKLAKAVRRVKASAWPRS